MSLELDPYLYAIQCDRCKAFLGEIENTFDRYHRPIRSRFEHPWQATKEATEKGWRQVGGFLLWWCTDCVSALLELEHLAPRAMGNSERESSGHVNVETVAATTEFAGQGQTINVGGARLRLWHSRKRKADK